MNGAPAVWRVSTFTGHGRIGGAKLETCGLNGAYLLHLQSGSTTLPYSYHRIHSEDCETDLLGAVRGSKAGDCVD